MVIIFQVVGASDYVLFH